MPTYHFYIFEKNGNIASTPITRELADNNAALTEAQKLLNDGAVEIWRGTSKVGRLDLPSPPRVLPAL
jgi:hypothetical protein